MKKISALLICLSLFGFNSKAQLTLLSGVEGGSYFQMATELNSITDLDLKVLPSPGSRENFFKIKESEVDLAFIQYDVLYYQTGIEGDVSKKVENIRILLPMGYEEIHLITLNGNNINSLKDLKGKKVGVGSKYMGTIITVSYIRDLTGGKWKDVRIPMEDALVKLFDGEVDALFFVGSAPVQKFEFLPDIYKDKVKLVDIKNEELNKYYAKVTIPGNTYNWMKEDVETFAVRYALTTNTTNENDQKRMEIRQLLNDIKSHIATLQETGHPMWKNVDFSFDRIIWNVHDVSKEVFDLKNVENKF